jgi:hypothetical protein
MLRSLHRTAGKQLLVGFSSVGEESPHSPALDEFELRPEGFQRLFNVNDEVLRGDTYA